MNKEVFTGKESNSLISEACNEEFSEHIVLKDQDSLFHEYVKSHSKVSPSSSMNEELLNDKESTSFVSKACTEEFSEHIVLKDQDHISQEYLPFISEACNEESSEHIVLKDQDSLFHEYVKSHTKVSPSLSMNEELLNDKESTPFVSEPCTEELSEHIVLKDQDHISQEYLHDRAKKSPSLNMNEELLIDKQSTSFVSEVCNGEFSEHIILKDQDHVLQQYLPNPTKKLPNLDMNEEVFSGKESTSFISEAYNEEFSEHIVSKDQDPLIQHYPQNHIKEGLRSHTKERSRSHAKDRSFVCEVCNKEFHKKAKLDFHFLIHTRPFICEVCNQRFSRNSHLKDHLRIHTKEKPYMCDVCHKEFSKKQNFDIHLRVHTKEKNYICEICNKGFSQKSNLTTHLLTHTQQKDYVCEICNKGFTRKSQLDEHVRIHTNEKSFICGICSRPFTHRSALNMHFRIHTKEKAFSCEICNKAFTHKSSLNLHYQVHSKVKSFVCEICNKAFSHKSTLKKHHLRIHINAEFSEHIVFKNQDNLFQQYFENHTKLSPNLSMSQEPLNNNEPEYFASEICSEEFSEHNVLKEKDNLVQQYLHSHTNISSCMNEELLNNKESTSFAAEISNEQFSEHIVLKDQDRIHTNVEPSL